MHMRHCCQESSVLAVVLQLRCRAARWRMLVVHSLGVCPFRVSSARTLGV